LYVSREKPNPSGALSPCNMSPDDVDYEMSKGKNKKVIEFCGMEQKSFEYFVEKYGETYEFLSFFKCQLISDFSPLEKLKKIEGIGIYWNIRANTLWDMSQNPKLEYLNIKDTKKIAYNPVILQKAKYLKFIEFHGDIFSPYPMQSLEWMRGMSSLENVKLHLIKLEDRSTDILEAMPSLKRFDFPAGMFTTEEIAYMCAKYPHISGQSLRAYNTEDAMLNDIRVCGYRKPGLDLPKGQARLDKYIKEFDALVEKYKAELKNNT
jgi:hypothetical protein